ncbi:uncharacterized protein LOC131309437 [Rhododendron vialii]|uniref:uncharacterized protein LOC131309437 n=1 Tax=Rhododendron vialii TaxID=182163 RepID=UPI00265D8E93|nr:uncharacterized protein LOC131309437 [Rhododendron vialii]
METGITGEPEVEELAISTLYPSVDDVGGGDQPRDKCVCVIGSHTIRFPDLDAEEEGDSYEGTGRWCVQFFLAEGSISTRNNTFMMGSASSGEALDHFEYVSSVDQAGILAVHKPFKQVKMEPYCCSFTFLVAPDGSPAIYSLGGLVFPKALKEEFVASRDVRIFDFNAAAYTYGPSMEAPRVSPVVLVLDGKIYVFGGVRPPNNPTVSWAESLDMITTYNNADAHPWKPLHQPPVFFDSCGSFAVGVDDGENIFFGIKEEIKKEEEEEDCGGGGGRVSSGGGGGKAILVGSTLEGIFLVYHLGEDRWIQLPYKIPISFLGSWPVAVGHTLYWVANSFYAYDLRTRKLYAGVVQGLEKYLNDYIVGNDEGICYKPGLHHLGGNDFCLTWLDWSNVISRNFTRLHSTVIRVVMSEDGSCFLDALVVTSTCHLLPHGFCFEHSLLLDGLGCNHTIIKGGVSSKTVIPLDESLSVKNNAEAGSDYEGEAREDRRQCWDWIARNS